MTPSNPGADIRDMQRHATHTTPAMTGRYVRDQLQATSRVATLRVASRKNGKEQPPNKA